jgi:hypothetical protein
MIAALCAAAFGLAGLSSALAQATRTWVSGVGDDANPCSRTAPCKTFAGAISKTLAGGEISVLDPGGFGAVTITKAISIVAASDEGGVLAAGTTGIVVNAPGAFVHLKGLIIEGAQTGLTGVRVLAGDVTIDDCVIRNFQGGSGFGVDFRPTSASRVYIRNSSIFNNDRGVSVTDVGALAALVLDHSTVDRNIVSGVTTSGVNAFADLNASSVLSNPVGLQATGGSQIRSFGNNAITSGAPTSVLPLQ